MLPARHACRIGFHKIVDGPSHKPNNIQYSLTVRLLVTGTGGGTTELLGLATTGISNEEVAVVRVKDLLDLLLGGLIDVYCV